MKNELWRKCIEEEFSGIEFSPEDVRKRMAERHNMEVNTNQSGGAFWSLRKQGLIEQVGKAAYRLVYKEPETSAVEPEEPQGPLERIAVALERLADAWESGGRKQDE